MKLVFGLLFAGTLAAVALTVGGAVFLAQYRLPLEEARPWTLLTLSEALIAVDPDAYGIAWRAVVATAAIAVLVLLAALYLPGPEKIHGDARFARRDEIRAAGLRARTGVIVGKTGPGSRAPLLRHDRETHTLLVAPTGAGKGVGVVIPNLLTYGGSVLVVDVKGENWEKTAGARQAMGDQVFRFSPRWPDGCSHRWNPLAYVSADPARRISDLRKIAVYLLPVVSKDADSWVKGARNIFTATALLVLDQRKTKTIGEIYRTLFLGGPFADTLKALAATEGLDPEAKRLFEQYAGFADDQLSGYFGSLEPLNLWADPLIDAATAENDFDLREIRRTPTSIYLSVAPDEIEALSPLVRLFFQQAIGLLHSAEPDQDEPYPVLLLLDEFRTLGKMETILSAVTTLRSFGGRLLFVVQGLSGLDELYGPRGRDAITGNCGVQVFFGTSDSTTADYLVKRLGRKTVRQVARITGGGKTPSRNASQTGRDLMTADEIARIDPRRAIVFAEGARPLLGWKVRWFAERRFAALRQAAPDVTALVGKQSVDSGAVSEMAQATELAARKQGRADRSEIASTPLEADASTSAVRALPSHIEQALESSDYASLLADIEAELRVS